jgi:hypothetical protein
MRCSSAAGSWWPSCWRGPRARATWMSCCSRSPWTSSVRALAVPLRVPTRWLGPAPARSHSKQRRDMLPQCRSLPRFLVHPVTVGAELRQCARTKLCCRHLRLQQGDGGAGQPAAVGRRRRGGRRAERAGAAQQHARDRAAPGAPSAAALSRKAPAVTRLAGKQGGAARPATRLLSRCTVCRRTVSCVGRVVMNRMPLRMRAQCAAPCSA